MSSRNWVLPTREAILQALRAADVPVTPTALAELLSVPADQWSVLQRRLAAMERDGQLLPNRKGVLMLASRLDLIAGRIQGHRDGFGFLIPDAGGADLFLSPREMQKAMHGDRALVRRVGYDARGRPEGLIVEVTDRAHRQLVGRFVNERGVHIVIPEDQRIKHDIIVPPGDTHAARHGQVVTIEIVSPPANGAPPIGRVVEVLGAIGDPGMEIEIAVRKFDVPHVFSASAQSLAKRLPACVRPTDLRNRVDLRDVPLVTIDGSDARDFDDAVYCELIDIPDAWDQFVGGPESLLDADKQSDGGGISAVPPRRRRSGARVTKTASQTGFRLLVAIADVAHYVKPGDALDLDARERSTSVYFPRRVIPMLPESLSNGLCSLNPGVDRLVLVCDQVIDDKGRIRAYQFYEAVMHSAARLTYDEVWSLLSNSDASRVGLSSDRTALLPQLQRLHDLYRALAGARQRRGALDLETTETRILCDALGRIERIVASTRNDAHKLIEECMLAANVCAADFLQRSEHAGLFRVHEGPPPDRLASLREFLRSVGLSLGGGDRPSPSDYAVLAREVRTRPDSALMQTMLLRSMQQAVYSPENVGHFGLAYRAYTHFTSPIRRYPDLTTHRVIKALLTHRRFEPDATAGLDEDVAKEAQPGMARHRAHRAASESTPTPARITSVWRELGLQCSTNERRADEASRDVEAWLKCQYMRERVGEQFAGRITGVAPFGVFVTLTDLFVEGLVHVSELGGEYFQYIEHAHELRGERTGRRFRLTDSLDVQVSRVDLEARRIEFRLVAPNQSGFGRAGELARDRSTASESPSIGAGHSDSVSRGVKSKAKPKTEAVSKARAERVAARRRKPDPTGRRKAPSSRRIKRK